MLEWKGTTMKHLLSSFSKKSRTTEVKWGHSSLIEFQAASAVNTSSLPILAVSPKLPSELPH